MQKKCFKCGQVKDLTEFYTHPQMSDGTVNKCKECNKSDVRKNYARRREHYSQYDRKRQQDPERRKRMVGYKKGYRRRNPEKDNARNAVHNAIRDGRLIRPDFCGVCGRVGKVQAHHHDYSKPLDVIWECFVCHREHSHGQIVTAKDYGSNATISESAHE